MPRPLCCIGQILCFLIKRVWLFLERSQHCMNLFKKINTRAQADLHTGFGTQADRYGGRFINKDGSANVQRRGLTWLDRISWYHTLLRMSRIQFIGVLFAFYTGVNFVFASIYYAIGVVYLDGIDTHGPEWVKFGKAYFFSAQTFTTVGYGHISPNGFLTSAVAATEALVGLLSFAIATGLFFGRFSRPRAYLKFSHHALISPYKKNQKALMLRMAPYKNIHLTDAQAKITLAMIVPEHNQLVNKFYTLDLELSAISSLNLSWTLVHPIDEKSPLFGFDAADFKNIDGELIVYVQAFDDMYSTTVRASTSYTFDEIIVGAKFEMMYDDSADNQKTILYLNKLNSYHPV